MEGCFALDLLKSRFSNLGSKKPLMMDLLKMMLASLIFNRKRIHRLDYNLLGEALNLEGIKYV